MTALSLITAAEHLLTPPDVGAPEPEVRTYATARARLAAERAALTGDATDLRIALFWAERVERTVEDAAVVRRAMAWVLNGGTR